MNGLKPPDQDELLPRPLDGRPNGVSLSRSPHPYHRRGGSLSHGDEVPEVIVEQSANAPPSFESTESGTEADDEKGSFLKGLPAPPPRLRKGLRGSTPPKTFTPSRTPLPTPPALVQQELSGYFETFQKDKKERDVSEDRRRTHEYIQRKAKEIVRRSLETTLLACICVLISTSADPAKIRPWLPELITTFCLPLLFYLAYPIRKSLTSYSSGSSVLKSGWLGFHVPSRFDPGPLLYPLVLPVIISISMLDDRSACLPVNLVCALCSIPERVTAIWNRNELLWYVRWVATMLPFHIPRARALRSVCLPTGLKLDGQGVGLEDFVLLYPLYGSLKSVLEYLTTTSLDPSELELLTTGLINLQFFAKSPQAQILKAIIWVGGLSIFVTCRDLLAWEVALARIPKWRFSKQPKDGSLSQRLKRALEAFFSSTKEHVESSDDEVDDRTRSRPLMRVKTLASTGVSALDRLKPTIPSPNGTAISATPLRNRGRRNTFSALEEKPHPSGGSRRPRRIRIDQSSYFLSLTTQQAQIRKYAYAGLAYLFVFFILFGPVWYYVRTRALSGSEPLGWALGYAFGDVPVIRQAVDDWGLAEWIKLPAIAVSSRTFWGLIAYPGNQRLLICVYCVLVLCIGIIVVLSLTAYVEVDTRRKVFHGVMVAMLLPTIFVDPCFLALALAIILAAFLLLDLFRASQLPPISRPLTNFLAPYTDGRDHRGPVIVSHIFLLIGCAIPLWLSLAWLPRSGDPPWSGWDVPSRDLSMISGVVCVGMGDAAASLIGRRYGRTKWYWAGGKSLEGSLAFAMAVTVGLMFSYFWLRAGDWVRWDDNFDPFRALVKCVIAGSGASLLESVLTAANDNVVVPIGLWLLVRGLKI